MCVDVNLIPEAAGCSSVADLMAAGFVVSRSDMPDDYEWTSDECLCNVDVEAILARSGRSFDHDDEWGCWNVTGGAVPEGESAP